MNRHRSNWSAMGSFVEIESYNDSVAYRDLETMFNKQKIKKIYETSKTLKEYIERCRLFIDLGYSDYVYSLA